MNTKPMNQPSSGIIPKSPAQSTLDTIARTPPANTDIEAALLGAILRNNRAFDLISDLLEPAHFYAAEHAWIFEQFAGYARQGKPVSAETLKHIVDAQSLLQEAGGSAYLFELVGKTVSVISVRDHAQLIRDLAIKRALIDLGETIVNDAFDLSSPDRDANAQIESAEGALYQLSNSGQTAGRIMKLELAARQALDNAEKAFMRDGRLVGVPTGLRDIDAMLGGMHASDLLVLAGRPAMGKTGLATNIAFNTANRFESIQKGQNEWVEGGRVLFFSLEMSASQLANRILAEMINIPSDRIRRGAITQDQFSELSLAANRLSEIPLYIDDTPSMNVNSLHQRARRFKRTHGLELIIIDYLQLLMPSRRHESRVQEVSEITRVLKAVARELDVPVLALSQLSRQVEQREDKRPQLSDLRESGSIEQDADVVCFIYRPEYYLSKSHPEQRESESDDHYHTRLQRHETALSEKRNLAELIIAKQRHGPTGVIDLHFQRETTRFSDYDSHEDPQGGAL
ncbi:MAG: replicative DNA helicase [Pseudomonadota bacterium]